MIEPLVTIITPTVCSKYLDRVLKSVSEQTYQSIQHLVVIDGPRTDIGLHDFTNKDVIRLPYNTGHDQYNGHRIYGACTFLAKGELICFLDEDNWIEPNHIQSMVDVLKAGNNWAYSLRKIVDEAGNFVCNDDCESIGKYPSILGEKDFFVDVNCYMLPKSIALSFAPGWYRRARHPQEQPEVDRLLSWFLFNQNEKLKCDTTGQYTVNYMVGSRADSVQKEFFLRGNSIMEQRYSGKFPWRK